MLSSLTQRPEYRIATATLIVSLPVLITLAIYWPGLYGPFLLDDQNNIAPLIIDRLGLYELIDVAAHNTSGPLGRPVSVLSLALTQYFSGATSFAFKYTNLMIHCIIGMLVFMLTLRILAILYPRKNYKHITAVAFFVALIWLIHPLNVSTVLYAVQRMAQLATLFTIAGVLCFVIARQHLMEGSQKKFWFWIACLSIFAVLAVFSKENGALLPLYLALIEITVFFKTTVIRQVKTSLNIFRIVWIILPILFAALYVILNFQNISSSYGFRDFDLPQRLLTQVHVIFLYMQLILIPKLRDMSLYHDYFPITTSPDLVTILLILFFTALITVAVLARKRFPLVTLGIGWFFVSHLMESTIFPLEMVFEHRNYPAIYGLLLPVIYYLTPDFGNRVHYKKLRLFTLSVIVILLSSQTAIRANTWADKELLLLVTVQDHPESSRARSELANVLFTKGDFVSGLQHLDAAEKLNPSDPGVNLHKILVYCHFSGVPENIIQSTITKLKHNKLTPYALSGIDVLIQRKRDARCPTINIETIFTIIQSALGNTYKNKFTEDVSYLNLMMARTHLLADDYKLAMEYYDQAYEINPKQLRPLIEKADIQIGINRFKEAQATIDMIESSKQGQSITEKHNIDTLKRLLHNAKTVNADE